MVKIGYWTLRKWNPELVMENWSLQKWVFIREAKKTVNFIS